ncbi:hypothetical protein, partial [Flavobacterium macacae]
SDSLMLAFVDGGGAANFITFGGGSSGGGPGGGGPGGGGSFGGGGGPNSRGVGRNYGQISFLGTGGFTFFGAPIRLIPFDAGASSYFGGAINVYQGNWEKYLKKGLNSPTGRYLMHEYGHYLQEKHGGKINYYTQVVPASLESFNNDNMAHGNNWTEVQASTLAWVYFNYPDVFDTENVINYNAISFYSPNLPLPYELIQILENQYINHPDYKPS